MKRCLTLVVRVTHIKNVMRYHSMLTGMATIKTKCEKGCGETITLIQYCDDYQMVQLLWRTFSQKVKTQGYHLILQSHPVGYI